MSYDVRLQIDTGGEDPHTVTEWHNPTFNLAPMFDAALGRSLRSMEGMAAKDAVPILRKAIADMEDRPDHFKTFNPPNGWGDFDGALGFFRKFLVDCLAHPKAMVRI